MKFTLLWATVLSSDSCPMFGYVHNDEWMQGNCDRRNSCRTGHYTITQRFCGWFGGAGHRIRCGRCCVGRRIAGRCFTNIIITIDIHILVCCCYRHFNYDNFFFLLFRFTIYLLGLIYKKSTLELIRLIRKRNFGVRLRDCYCKLWAIAYACAFICSSERKPLSKIARRRLICQMCIRYGSHSIDVNS